MKSYGNQPIAIAGHTDSVGRPEANQVLSENRANAVKEWLASRGGVPADRISTRGHGQTQPTAANDTAEDVRRIGASRSGSENLRSRLYKVRLYGD